MQNAVWRQAIETSADPQRAGHFVDLFATTPEWQRWKDTPLEQARIFTALFSGSQALSEILLANPAWAASSLRADDLAQPRQMQGLQREIESWLRPLLDAGEYGPAFQRLREFKHHEMLRVAARDLARLGNAVEVTREISNIADLCLQTVYRLCERQLTQRLGSPFHQDPDGGWVPTPFCVFGMGKLGGQELNYSSDVDVIFVYGEEGTVFREPPRKGAAPGKALASHQFFKRLAEMFIAEVGRMTAAGALFRIDLRLRPEGNSGPLARSLSSYENYYAQWGQTWERMMLIKARCVAGDEGLASEFLEMIQPFRYPRSIGERVLHEIAAMKQRIEDEVVKAGEIDRNVKLGRGGIREIEFVVQTLQLIHAGRTPFLQGTQTLPLLQKLVQYDRLPEEDATVLHRAYLFLRDVEHRLQMENNLQTHTIPTDRSARTRVARLMGFATLEEFESARAEHSGRVRSIYDRMIKIEAGTPEAELPAQFENREMEWKAILAQHTFRDPDQAVHLVQTFIQGPGYVHVSLRTGQLARQLFARILDFCPKQGASRSPDKVLSDPDRVLARLDSFITAYGTRAMLYEMWTSNPSLFDLLLRLFDRSEFLAEIAIRTPDLVDELELSGRLRRGKNAEETLKDLRHGLNDPDQRLWLRRYHQAELMRIGLRDILGLADFEQNLVELSALADACLQYALEVVLRKHRFRKPPFVILGLGKLGGTELNYGSDLDIMFVAEPTTKKLPQLQKIAVEVMELISSPTEMGVAFPTDARLRPDGEKGLLVNTLTAYEDYYRQRAQLWEVQSISRTRPIAGHMVLGEKFQSMVASLTNFKALDHPPAAYRPDWKKEIARMRLRIEKERTPAGKDHLAIKTGAGGLMDAEFIAQVLCLEHGWHEPNTLQALLRGRDSGALAADSAGRLIENYRKLRHIEGILRRWSLLGETLLPVDPAPLYRVAVRCGFPDAETFMRTVAQYRKEVRAVYKQVLETGA